MQEQHLPLGAANEPANSGLGLGVNFSLEYYNFVKMPDKKAS